MINANIIITYLFSLLTLCAVGLEPTPPDSRSGMLPPVNITASLQHAHFPV